METDLELRVLRISRNQVKPSGLQFIRPGSRMWHSFVLFLSDILAFSVASVLAIAVRVIFEGVWRFELLLQVIPLILMSTIFYSLVGLYPATGMSPVEELRKLITTTSLVVIALAAMSFWARNAEEFSRLTLGLTWLFSLFLLPLSRDSARSISARFGMWGEPVAIIGCGKQGKWALDFFQRNRKLGLHPIAMLDFDDHNLENTEVQILKIKDVAVGHELGKLLAVETALVVLSDVPASFLKRVTDHGQGGFKRLILIPNLEQISSYGVMSFDFGGVLGLEIRHNLMNPAHMLLKRVLDVVLVIVGGLLILPFLLLVAVLLKIDSKGAVLYGHTRIGKDGTKFTAWKFRTMVTDADARLKHYLGENQEMHLEWESHHKLKDDPRVTRFGRFLRKYSIDELPQLLNVLRGEMSLVGPRPIVLDEVRHYGALFESYTWVLPGITGLWQVSGRTNTGYVERVHLDEYYIRNWSIWLDFHILARTVSAVLRKDGAY